MRGVRVSILQFATAIAETAAAMASSLASSLLGTPLVAPAAAARSASVGRSSNGASVLRIECSSHPQKKATAHHAKSRPKKHQPYDKNRKGPTYYPRLPKAPPIWGFDTSDLEQTSEVAATESSVVEA